MKDIVYAIITALKADTSVAAVASTLIYRKKLPTDPTFPAITVSKVDGIRDGITNTGGYAHSRVQVTTWAETPGPEDDLAETCTDVLHRLTNKTVVYAPGKWVRIISVTDAGGLPDDNPDIPLYMEHRDFMIHYDYR